MKKDKDIQAKRGGCKNCPPATNMFKSDVKQKINVSERNENYSKQSK